LTKEIEMLSALRPPALRPATSRRYWLLFLTLALWALLVPASLAQTIANSSFETPSIGASNYSYNPSGGSWAFAGNSGIQSNGSAWGAANAPDGTQTAFLQGNPNQSATLGSISQSVNFPATGTYVISFQAARRYNQVQPVKLSVDGTQVGSLLTPPSSSFSLLTTASFTVSAAGPHTIMLAGTDGSADLSTFVDQVTITPASAAVVPVSGLFSTGLDSSGSPLADGAVDPHYTITAGPDGAGNAAHVTLSTGFPIPPWLADTTASKWISPQANQSGDPEPPGSYVYRTTFSLAGLDPSTVQITGQMLADDRVTDVRINGTLLGLAASGFASWTPLSIKSGFQAGVNTLDFLLTNAGTSNNPSGLRVELSGTGNAAPLTLSSITVSPPTATLNPNGTQQFTAVANDQNGNALSSQPAFTWSVASGGVGAIGSTTGLYSAGTTPGSATVQATSGGVTGTAAVTVGSSGPDFTLTTSTSTFTLSGSLASPGSAGIGLINGSTTDALLITPLSTFSGNVTLAVSGLPGGTAFGFSPTSPVSVTSGNPASLTLTVQANGAAPGVYPLTVTATSGTLVHTLPLTLIVAPGGSVSQLSLTDLFMPATALIQWPAGTHSTSTYTITRNVPGMSPYQSGTLFLFDASIQIGTTYTYHVTNHWTDPPYFVNNTEVFPQGTDDLGTISVTPQQAVVSDNQSVDARYDLRYSTWTFLDHNFGTTTYRGGLFAGYNADQSQVGHAYLKFASAVPAGKTLWPVGSVNAYFTRCYAAGTATVACQTVPSTWTGSTVTWDTAPPLVPASATATPLATASYDGVLAVPTWLHWEMGSAIAGALTGSTGTYAAALNATNEPAVGSGTTGTVPNGGPYVWAYFDKKESLDNQPPCILYAYNN